MIAKTRLEISKGAIKHNLDFLRSKAGSAKIMAVVKANGYGTDLIELSKTLLDFGVECLCVAYVQEGLALRNSGIKAPILVLHAQVEDIPMALQTDLDLCLYSIDFTQHLVRECRELGNCVTAHLNLNTGLNRLGLKFHELDKLLEILGMEPKIRLDWCMTHLIGSEDPRLQSVSLNQFDQFEMAVTYLEKRVKRPLKKHALNSSGLLNYPEKSYEMVRLGISLHGYSNDPALDSHLRPISTWHSVLSDIRWIEKGESVSYNQLYIAEKRRRIATIPVGHADGFSRNLGWRNGRVSIKGQWAPVVGMVCMDLFMVDITEINAELGDPVVIMGPENSAAIIAGKADTIAYELLTGIGSRIPRVFN